MARLTYGWDPNRELVEEAENAYEATPVRDPPWRDPRDHRKLPRNPFGDTILLFRAFPELGKRFDRVVPAEYVDERGVLCVCEATTPLEDFRLIECEGLCGRWFLRVGDVVRRAHFKDEA